MSIAQEFIENPSVEAFNNLKKEQLLELATYYEIELSASEKRLKNSIKTALLPVLVEKRVLPPVDMKDSIRLKELSIRERELDNEREELSLRVSENELEMKRLDLKARQENIDLIHTGSFDVSKNIRLVPPFIEKDVVKYFPHFEKVALTLSWPKEVWTLLIQSVLTGRAQEVYSSLALEQSKDYDVVKAAILRCYQLVPEAYRQRFRRCEKTEHQTYIEFAREKEALFDRWCSSSEVDSRAKLRALILVEEFKNCLPDVVATYLNEHKVDSLHEAAVLADEFVLTHRIFQDRYKPVGSSLQPSYAAGHSSSSPERACFYCKKPGHLVADCPVLKKKQAAKGFGLIKASPYVVSPCLEYSNDMKNDVTMNLFLVMVLCHWLVIIVSFPYAFCVIPVLHNHSFWRGFCLCLKQRKMALVY